MWTSFNDAHTNGIQKLEWNKVLIEANESEAISVFYSRFGINPNRVSCTCCGSDYSVWEDIDVAEFVQDDALFIPAEEILESERQASVPVQGYVWT